MNQAHPYEPFGPWPALRAISGSRFAFLHPNAPPTATK